MIIPNESFLETFKKTPGAISICESVAILNLSIQAPPGVYLDCGSHAGKSAMSAAQGLQNGTFYLVDPIYDMENKENKGWPYVNDAAFCDNIIENVARNKILPVLIGDNSINVIPKYGPYSWVFIDSDDHQEELVMEEVRLLEDRIVSGGIVAFHDYKNQYIWPAKAHEYLISTGKFENIPIDWERIKDHVRKNNLENGNNSWHREGSNEFPIYVGACKRK